MRAWIVVIGFACLFSGAAFAEDVSIDEILQGLKKLNCAEELNPPKPQCTPPAPSDPTQGDLAFTRLSVHRKGVCSDQGVDLTALCSNLEIECDARFLSWSCRQEGPEIKKRFDNPELRGRIFSFAAKKFNQYTQDPALQKTCCGDNSKCASQLAATKLLILKGLPPEDLTAYYVPQFLGFGHSVKISEGYLLNSFIQEGIEEVFLHELGHACQWARRAIFGTSFGLNLDYGNCERHGISKRDFEEVYGSEVTSCVLGSLEEHRKKMTQDSCLGSWTAEAFANAIFLPKFWEAGHYFRSCDTTTDLKHSDRRVYFHCFMKLPAVTERLCGKKGNSP